MTSTVTLGYDLAGRLSSEVMTGFPEVSYGYDDEGLRTSLKRNGTEILTYSYDDASVSVRRTA